MEEKPRYKAAMGRLLAILALAAKGIEGTAMAYEEPGYVVVRAVVDYEIRRYSGRWSEDRYREHERMLTQSIDRDGVETHGSPAFARYNGSWTPWFMRRNQVMIPMTDESL